MDSHKPTLQHLWKLFNKAVDKNARCVLCNRCFEFDVFMCTHSHNLCHSCYSPELAGTNCSVEKCIGVWLGPQHRNLLLSQLSRLRMNLYHMRENISKWFDPPWEELVSCVICTSQLNDEIFMCHNGHSWCGTCHESVRKYQFNEKCPYCNEPFLIKDRRNFSVELIIKGMNPERKACGPIRRKGLYKCPIFSCKESQHLHNMFTHLRFKHSDKFYAREKTEFVEGIYYELTSINPIDFSGAFTIYSIGLFGVHITFHTINRKYLFKQSRIFIMSAFHPVYAYELRLDFRTLRNRTASIRQYGNLYESDPIDEKPEFPPSEIPVNKNAPIRIWVKITPKLESKSIYEEFNLEKNGQEL